MHAIKKLFGWIEANLPSLGRDVNAMYVSSLAELAVIERQLEEKEAIVYAVLAPYTRMFLEIAEERERQIETWGDDQNKDPHLMMSILMEEVGETARAALVKDYANMRHEAMQTATVALAIMEGSRKMMDRALR